IPLSSAVTATTLAAAREQGAVLAWGNFLTLIINFLIIAFVIFQIVQIANKLNPPPPPPAPAGPTADQKLLTEIRDLLAKGK
ncbi:MAG TPA: MscL family protein, partial [Anaerolineales bacterium]|nr:MscL family protein [Anaerolineales bacterium]